MTEHNETAPPAAEELPAGWPDAPAPPAWVLEQNFAAKNWRNLGARRWRADLPDPFAPILLLMVNAAGTATMRYAFDLDYGDGRNDEVIAEVFGHLQESLDHEALPECVAPGCTEKGVSLMVAAELGHLAGKVYAKGDEIRMCQPHGYDVYRAGEGLDQIAEWLRPDAEVLDPWHYAAASYDRLTPDQLRQKHGRLPRLLNPGGPTP